MAEEVMQGSVAASRIDSVSQGGSIMNRYADAYKKAHFINRLGTMIKIVGLLAGGTIFLTGMTLLSMLFRPMFGGPTDIGSSIGTLFFSTCFAALAWFCFYILGTLVSAGGQFLLSSLDAAVNNSPFLDNLKRATIMGL